MRLRLLAALVFAGSAALLLALGCGKGTPVAPAGTTIRLTVNPSVISLTQTCQVTALVRKENGTPVNPGTIVLFASSLGTITPSVATDSQGIATAELRADGRIGTAKVSASSGPTSTDPVDVQIGLQAGAATLTATPSTIGESGGKISLRALIRDGAGQPLAGALVNFQTQIGTLASGGSFVTTTAAGEATDSLQLSSGDVGTLSGDSFTVTVQASGTSGVVSDDVTIGIQRRPKASFDVTVTGLVAVFKDTSTGKPTSWKWDFGDNSPISTQQNPAHSYAAPGSYVVTLTVTNSQDSSTASGVVQIRQ